MGSPRIIFFPWVQTWGEMCGRGIAARKWQFYPSNDSKFGKMGQRCQSQGFKKQRVILGFEDFPSHLDICGKWSYTCKVTTIGITSTFHWTMIHVRIFWCILPKMTWSKPKNHWILPETLPADPETSRWRCVQQPLSRNGSTGNSSWIYTDVLCKAVVALGNGKNCWVKVQENVTW